MFSDAEDVVIRAASAEDLPGLRDVAHRTWRATYSGAIPDADIERFLEANYNIERLTQSRDRMGSGLLVAAIQDEITGYAMLSKNQTGSAELWAIYVLPDWQGRGVGRLLWDHAREVSLALGVDEMVLWVLDSNIRARRFYERQGAIADDERNFSVGAGSVREARYRLPLT